MKVKIFAGSITAFLLVLSILEIFPVYPGPGQIFPLYKSGYFGEMDRNNRIIADAFTGVKVYGRVEMGWAFLDDVRKRYNIQVDVYDSTGNQVPSPGTRSRKDSHVAELLALPRPAGETKVEGNRYVTVLPLVNGGKCRPCHSSATIGALYISREFNAGVYYTLERRLIFIPLAVFLLILFMLIVRWEPGRRIEEMFDKS